MVVTRLPGSSLHMASPSESGPLFPPETPLPPEPASSRAIHHGGQPPQEAAAPPPAPGSAALSYPAEAGGPHSSPGPWGLGRLVGSLFPLFPRLPFPWPFVPSSWREMITHRQGREKGRDGSCLPVSEVFGVLPSGFQRQPSSLPSGASSPGSRAPGEPLPEHSALGPFGGSPSSQAGTPPSRVSASPMPDPGHVLNVSMNEQMSEWAGDERDLEYFYPTSFVVHIDESEAQSCSVN